MPKKREISSFSRCWVKNWLPVIVELQSGSLKGPSEAPCSETYSLDLQPWYTAKTRYPLTSIT